MKGRNRTNSAHARMFKGITSVLPVMAMLVLTVNMNIGAANAGIVTQAVHDLVILGIAPSKTIVGQGFGLQVEVTVSNRGDYPEALNVTLYANATTNATTIATFTAQNLINGTSVTIDFSWNTKNSTKGNYTLSAYAWPVPGEIDTTNNYFTGGWVAVATPGDLTGGTDNLWDCVPDGKVDFKDVAIITKYFYSIPGDPRWNPNCDVNNDGRVDSKDLAVVGKYFGQAQNPVDSFGVGIYAASWNFGEYDAQTIASHFDMSQSWFVSPSGRNDYTQKMVAVKSLNPDYKALMYHNVWGIDSSDPNWNLAKANGWLLKDANGSYVSDKTYPTLYPADITNASYQQWVAALIKSHLDACSYFDGVMADNGIKASALEWAGYNRANPPINPRTGAPFTDAEVLDGYLALQTAIKNAIGSKILFVNGIWNGPLFYNTYDRLVNFLSRSPMSGIMSEGCWYQGRGSWMTEANWLKSLNFVVWMQDNWLNDHPERVFDATCGSGFQWTMPSGCTNQQMMLYGYCSTLLGIEYPLQNTIAFAFQNTNATIMQLIQRLHDINLVSPLNDYHKITPTSVYARDFVGGKVLVNPTDVSYTITLDGNYTTLDGTTVSNSLTVDAHCGLILLS